MPREIDLSVVVTAHDEGLVAHKTMRSVFEALEGLKRIKKSYEIIVHIDNGDKKTLKYFDRYSGREDVRIFKNKFGDTGPSRNYAVSKANGKYVAFLDGDDLVSSNWFVMALKMLESAKEKIIVHPEAILTFGFKQPHVLTMQKDSFNDGRDVVILLGENRWCSVLMAEKEVLEQTPYHELKNGYGHEDYVFNIETLEKNIPHKIAKETVLFYRRTETSRLSMGNSQHVTIPAMRMFDLENINIIQRKMRHADVKNSVKEKGYKMYKKIRNNKVLNYFIIPVAKLTLKVLESDLLGGASHKKVPDFVVKAWVEINHIDSQLYPYKAELSQMKWYSAEEQLAVGNTYLDVSKRITGRPDYVFIIPWIVRGGADKVLFNYLNALKEINPNWHFTVISTLPNANVWAEYLPDGVDYIDFGNIARGLTPDAQNVLMTRLITQLRCKRIHIINSEFGYLWARAHRDLLEHYYILNVSLFAWEYIRESNKRAVFSYDDPYLFDIYPAVKNVFTDNKNMIRYTVEHNGFDKERFKVHYQPIKNTELCQPKTHLIEENKIRIMWAGRVVKEKLPDLVAAIGKKIDASKISIDIYGEMGKDVKTGMFNGISAIKYCGKYDGFSSLPTEKYDMFLYTSLNDGMPNVILEAAAAGCQLLRVTMVAWGSLSRTGKPVF